MRQISPSALSVPCLRCAQHFRAARPFRLHCKPISDLLQCPSNLKHSACLSRVARRRPSFTLHAEGVPHSETPTPTLALFPLHDHSIKAT